MDIDTIAASCALGIIRGICEDTNHKTEREKFVEVMRWLKEMKKRSGEWEKIAVLSEKLLPMLSKSKLTTSASTKENNKKMMEPFTLCLELLLIYQLRINELAGLKGADVSADRLFVPSWQPRGMMLPEQLFQELKEYISTNNIAPSDNLFPFNELEVG